MKDAIIIGGGPVGLHAARRLAAEGFDVEVLEEHACADEPVHCTGILSPEIFREFQLPPDVILNELNTVEFHSPGGQVIHYRTERVEAVVVDRRAFDRNLRSLASASGAQVTLGAQVQHVETGGTGVLVHCAGTEPREARACILSAGATYALHRDLGIGFPPVHLNCTQVELPVGQKRDVEIYLGRDVAPKGFAWAVPVRRADGIFARVGLMCEGDTTSYFERFLPRLDNWKIPSGIEVQPRQRMLPLTPIRKTYGDRLLVAGDAAGFVKPVTGGGVYYGMISAGIAAAVLAQALRRDRLNESELSRYQQLWQERLMEEIEAQLTLRLLLQRLTDGEVETIFDLWATDSLMPLVRKTATFNQYRKLIAAVVRNPGMRKILFNKMLS